MTFVIAAVFSLVQAAVVTGQASIERGRIESRIASLRTDIAEIELGLVEATTPAAIVARSRRLGLVFPTETGVLRLRSDRGRPGSGR